VLRPVSRDAEVDAAGVFDQLADQELGLVTAERGPGGLEAVLGLLRHGGGGLGAWLRAAIRPRSLQHRSSVNEGS